MYTEWSHIVTEFALNLINDKKIVIEMDPRTPLLIC